MNWKKIAEDYKKELYDVQSDLYDIQEELYDVCMDLAQFDEKMKQKGKAWPKAMLKTFKRIRRCKAKAEVALEKSDEATWLIELTM